MKSMYNDRTMQKSFVVNLRDYLKYMYLEEKLITMYWSNLFVKPFKNELSNSITTLKSIEVIYSFQLYSKSEVSQANYSLYISIFWCLNYMYKLTTK